MRTSAIGTWPLRIVSRMVAIPVEIKEENRVMTKVILVAPYFLMSSLKMSNSCFIDLMANYDSGRK